MSQRAPGSKRLVQCELHQLAYDPTVTTGCVLCRRSAAPPMPPPVLRREFPVKTILAFVVIALVAGLLGFRQASMKDRSVVARAAAPASTSPKVDPSLGTSGDLELLNPNGSGAYYLPPHAANEPLPFLLVLADQRTSARAALAWYSGAAQLLKFAVVTVARPDDPSRMGTLALGALWKVANREDVLPDRARMMVVGHGYEGSLAAQQIATASEPFVGFAGIDAQDVDVETVGARAIWGIKTVHDPRAGKASSRDSERGSVRMTTYSFRKPQLDQELATVLSKWLDRQVDAGELHQAIEAMSPPKAVSVETGPCAVVPRPLTCPPELGTSFDMVPAEKAASGENTLNAIVKASIGFVVILVLIAMVAIARAIPGMRSLELDPSRIALFIFTVPVGIGAYAGSFYLTSRLAEARVVRSAPAPSAAPSAAPWVAPSTSPAAPPPGSPAALLAAKFPPHNGIERAMNATVVVHSRYTAGSGFFVNNRCDVLTNRHVVTLNKRTAQMLRQRAEELQRGFAAQKDYPRTPEERKFDELMQKALEEEGGAAEGELAMDLKILTRDGATYPVADVRVSSTRDLALLKIAQSDCPAIGVADPAAVPIGTRVYTIGNPADLGLTVTSGVLSRYDRIDGTSMWLQTDAPINPGNSGGPLVTEEGKAIGITTAMLVFVRGIGFSMPIAYAFEEFGMRKD